jgi:hypothetical protein
MVHVIRTIGKGTHVTRTTGMLKINNRKKPRVPSIRKRRRGAIRTNVFRKKTKKINKNEMTISEATVEFD